MYFAIKGIYDKGQIIFLEQVPDIGKANVVVLFESESEAHLDKNSPSLDTTRFSQLQAFGMWKNRKDIKDDLKFAGDLREQWDRADE